MRFLIVGGDNQSSRLSNSATAVAQEEHATGGSVYEIVLRKGLLLEEEFDRILRPETLTKPAPLNLHGTSFVH